MTKIAKNCKRYIAFLLTAGLILSFCTGCAQTKEEPVPEGTVRVGVLEPLTGTDAEKAKAELTGIELAHELHPEAGGLTVELVYADTESSLKKAVTAAETLVAKNCAACIGSYGNLITLAASDTFEAAAIPLLNVTGTNPLLTGSSPYLFRTATVETDQAETAADYLTGTLGLPDVAILLPTNDDYAEEMAIRFANSLGRDIRTVRYTKGTTDFSMQLAVLRSCGVRAVYLTGNAEDTAAFLAAAKAAHVNWNFFGTQNLKTEAFIETAGAAANGLCTTGDWDPLIAYTEMTEEFLRAYRERYGENVMPSEAEALGYEAYMLLTDAIGRAEEPTGEAIRSALLETESFAGVTGVAAMDREGNITRAQAIWMIADGTFVNPRTYIPPKQELENTADENGEDVFLAK